MNAPLKLTMMTFAAINEALPKLAKGQAMIYHVGSLMYDRTVGPHFQTVHGVALAAYQAYERGEVTLVQRKIAPLSFEYIAIRI